MEWGEFTIKDRKLICMYYLRDDDEFIHYEEKYLLGHPLFEDYKEVANDKAIYIFNFEEHAEDYDHVANGRYSEISQVVKNKIRDVYGAGGNNYAYIKSYLYPNDYYYQYAMMLSPQKKYVMEMHKILTEVKELCSKPDFTKERLKMSVKTLEL